MSTLFRPMWELAKDANRDMLPHIDRNAKQYVEGAITSICARFQAKMAWANSYDSFSIWPESLWVNAAIFEQNSSNYIQELRNAFPGIEVSVWINFKWQPTIDCRITHEVWLTLIKEQ